MRKHVISGLLVVFIAVLSVSLNATGKPSSQDSREVPKMKQTSLGLYVTAKEAYEMWKANPETVKILDVRTAEECVFVGHAEMAMNIPFDLHTYQWDASKHHFVIELNPDFISHVKEWAKPTDTILATCRSGPRGAFAVNALTEAGFTNVYNIIDGMEGDIIQDPQNVFYGKRMKNGWKNSGLPWTYSIDIELMRLPSSLPKGQ